MCATSRQSAARGWQLPSIVAVVVAVLLAMGVWMIWSAWRTRDLWGRAQRSAARGDWDQTESLLRDLSWYRPDDREVLRFQVRSAIERREPAVAARLLARVPSSSPEAVDARLSQGRLLIEAFLPREAEAAFRDCIRIDPESDAARLALIAILAVQRRSRDYEAETWALFEWGAEPIKALRLLAQASPAIPPDTFTREADIGDVLRRCLDAEPDDPHTRLALANFERRRGRVDEALRLLEDCLLNPATMPDARIEWAACLLDEGELDRLRPLFTDPPESVKRLGAYWLLRGEWARRMGLEAEAIENYRESIRLDPRSPDAYYRLGLALRESGPEASRCLSVAQKARDLKTVVSQIPNRSFTPAQLVHAGKICAEIGRLREARAWFSLALRTAPQDAEARAALKALDATDAGHQSEPGASS